ncbi:Co2+/Mg2+ efflux protein ApaG [Algicola sagamiensis]|uniref:Co2+/Mg2+ efflux protein ApaG n=1 Tax=Algicola sagamiensis TaxID=163869 RepID=UPI000380BEA4|nr:Co2+/Mg2+ efflux protein ApaG [Algicola sagamiensis]
MSIEIQVETQYISAQSSPEEAQYAFSYTITIVNHGEDTVQLISRYWLITDSTGKVTEVQGEGVVGKQPHIAPNETYTYTSGVMLESQLGTMEGHYLMRDSDQGTFQTDIPVFRLCPPNTLH